MIQSVVIGGGIKGGMGSDSGQVVVQHPVSRMVVFGSILGGGAGGSSTGFGSGVLKCTRHVHILVIGKDIPGVLGGRIQAVRQLR